MFSGGLCSELYLGVKGIKVGEQLLGVFCHVDDKVVIHVPKPGPGWIGGGADGSDFKVLHVQVIYKGLIGDL